MYEIKNINFKWGRTCMCYNSIIQSIATVAILLNTCTNKKVKFDNLIKEEMSKRSLSCPLQSGYYIISFLLPDNDLNQRNGLIQKTRLIKSSCQLIIDDVLYLFIGFHYIGSSSILAWELAMKKCTEIYQDDE